MSTTEDGEPKDYGTLNRGCSMEKVNLIQLFLQIAQS